jgi:hypothetical protein
MKREMALIIGCAICSALGAVVLAAVFVAVGADKLTKKRKQPAEDNRVVKWLPMSQAHNTFTNWRYMSQMAPDTETVAWVKILIPDGASSHTNPAPFDRRRRPIHGTNIVHVSSLKGGIWAEADGFLRKQLPNKE